MKVIKPVKFTPAILVSTTATETVAAWSASTTYAQGAQVIYQQRLYESLAAGNVNKIPPTSITSWVDVGPSNIYAMFDDEVSTASTATTSLTVVLHPGAFNSIALFSMVGETLSINVTNGQGGETIYTKTQALDGTVIADWYQYFFEPYVMMREITLTDVPPYLDSYVTVTITGVGTVEIGSLIVGTLYDLGRTLTGVSLTTDDYSKVTTDEFGNTQLVRRNSSKRISLRLLIDRNQLRRTYEILDDLRATPAAWITSERADDLPLNFVGIRSSFSIVVEYSQQVLCALEIKGMT